jgi:hypothetical protein
MRAAHDEAFHTQSLEEVSSGRLKESLSSILKMELLLIVQLLSLTTSLEKLNLLLEVSLVSVHHCLADVAYPVVFLNVVELVKAL